MERAHGFLREFNEDILKFMDDHRDTWTHDKVTYLASMCDAYNRVCEFVENSSKYNGNMPIFGSAESIFGDNSNRRR